MIEDEVMTKKEVQVALERMLQEAFTTNLEYYVI
jgi:hypothetical protein